MATTVGTTADFVRRQFDTHRSDADIAVVLSDIESEIDRAYDNPDFDDDAHRQAFEAALARLRIAEGLDRRAESVQTGRSSKTYEESEIAALRKRVRREDPGTEFGRSSGVVRDDTRYVTSTDKA